MSAEMIEQVIRRAVTDEAFRETLFASPDVALEGFDLSDGERALFADLDEDGLAQALADANGGELDQRISKVGGWN